MARISRIWAVAAAAAMVGATLRAASPATAYPPLCRETLPVLPILYKFSVPPNSTNYASIPVAVAGQIADIDVRIWASGIVGANFTFGPNDDFAAHHVDLDSVGGAVDLEGATYDDEAVGTRPAMPPFSGSYRPISPLSALDGLQTMRSWRLEAYNGSASTFHVDAWTITITYAGCVPDGDSDGVADRLDSCPGVVAHSASGCPIASRGLTAKYKHGRFKGVLSSSVAGCRAARSVTIWKIRGGPDRKIGTATTRSDGSYKLVKGRKAGKYYTTSPRVVVAKAAECPATTSKRLRIR